MPDEQYQLDPAIQAMIDERIKPNECVHGWARVPTDDLVVFLSDRDLEGATQAVTQTVGHPLGRGRTLVFAFHDGEWSLVGYGFWGGGVQRLLQYFKAMASNDTNPQWRAGIELCYRWILLKSSKITQAEIDAVAGRLDAEPNPGPVWMDFREQFIHWARNQGYQA